jgi:iron complex transport system substrate-binding protein
MKTCRIYWLLLTSFCLSKGVHAAEVPFPEKKPERIVSLNGTVSEVLCELGLQAQLVGVDVTSTYPEALKKLPKVGHSRNLSAEGILALNPSLIVGTEESVKPEVANQLKSAGIAMRLFRQELSVAGTKQLIREIATVFEVPHKAQPLIARLDADLLKVKKAASPKKVLFIYARGTGSMMVAGQGTSVEKVIALAGGTNAATGFADFKPLTAEALIGANPDVILLFTSGLQSLGGIEGLLQVPGIAQTNAGRNRQVVEMDGQLLTGFGPRLGKAVAELANHLNTANLEKQ